MIASSGDRSRAPALLSFVLLGAIGCAPGGAIVKGSTGPVSRDSAAEAASGEAGARLARADALLREGKLDDAVLEYAGVRGERGGEALAGLAWERIAAVLETEGKPAETLRALLKARDADDAKGRARLTPKIDAALAALGPEERAARARTALGAGLSSGGDATGPLRVALLAPLTGRFENFGAAFRLGAEIALERRTSATLPSSSPRVEMLVTDTTGDSIRASLAAKQAIVERGCVAILGPLLSVPTLAVGGIADAHGVALLAPVVSESRLGELGPAVRTIAPSPKALARVLGETAVKSLGLRRVVVVAPGDPSSKARREEFAREAAALGGTIVDTLEYNAGEKDYRKVLIAARKTDSQAVYILGDSADLEIMAKQLDGVDLGRPILGHGEWADARIDGLARRSLEGSVLVVESGEVADSRFSRDLKAAVRARSGGELSRFHVYGFEAMDEVLTAVDLGARDADEVLEMLRRRDAWPRPAEGRLIEVWTRRAGAMRPFERP